MGEPQRRLPCLQKGRNVPHRRTPREWSHDDSNSPAQLSRSLDESDCLASWPSGERSYSPRNAQFRRKLLCNWGGNLGDQNLIAVRTNMEPIRAPYTVTVSYDLRPLIGKLTHGETVFLAALDAEKLRRKGSGTGLDALQASGNWIARDCICTNSGKLKMLGALNYPGEVRITLCPTRQKDCPEVCVLLRVVAIRQVRDPHDWHTLGAAVVLRCDTVGKMKQPDAQGSQPQREHVLRWSPNVEHTVDELPDESKPEYWGVRVQQLIDFRDEIRPELERYCGCHHVCRSEGLKYNGYHVCMYDPCPFRLGNKAKLEDHRGVPFVKQASMQPEEMESTFPLNPDIHCVVDRYIKPVTLGTGKNMAQIMNPAKPLRISAYISHSWTESYSDFIDTLESALDKDDPIFVACFSINQNSSRCQQPSDEYAFASALRRSDKLIVLVDRTLTVTQRIWCLYEIKKAKEWLVPSCVWPHQAVDLVALKETVSQLDLSMATASNSNETTELLKTVQRDNVHMKAINREIRDFLLARITCYVAAFQQSVDFKDFSPEKLRQLHTEHERRTTLKEIDREHKQHVSDMDGMVTAMDMEVRTLHANFKDSEAAHQLEIQNFQQKLNDQERDFATQFSGHEEQAKARLQAVLQEKEREIKELNDLLHVSRVQKKEMEARFRALELQMAEQKKDFEEERIRFAEDLEKQFVEQIEDADRRRASREEASQQLHQAVQEKEQELQDKHKAHRKQSTMVLMYRGLLTAMRQEEEKRKEADGEEKQRLVNEAEKLKGDLEAERRRAEQASAELESNSTRGEDLFENEFVMNQTKSMPHPDSSRHLGGGLKDFAKGALGAVTGGRSRQPSFFKGKSLPSSARASSDADDTLTELKESKKFTKTPSSSKESTAGERGDEEGGRDPTERRISKLGNLPTLPTFQRTFLRKHSNANAK